jgi:hypothetical protein
MDKALGEIKQPGSPKPVWDVTTVSTISDLENFVLGEGANCCDHFFVYFSAHGLRYVTVTDGAGNERNCKVLQDGIVNCGDCVSVAKAQADWYLENHHTASDNLNVVCPDPANPAQCMYCWKDGVPNHKATPAEEAGYKYMVAVEGYSLQESYLEEAIDALKSCNVTVFMDTCFSGGLTEHLQEKEAVFQVFTSATSDRLACYAETPEGTSSTLATFLACMAKLKAQFAAADPQGGMNVQEELMMRAGACLAAEDPRCGCAPGGRDPGGSRSGK